MSRGRLLLRLLIGNPPEQPTLDCWYSFEDGHHTCILPRGHDEPHHPTPDDEIMITLADPA